MKKLFFMLSLVLTAVLGANALTLDEVIGKWESNTMRQEPSAEMPMEVQQKVALDIKADGQGTLTLNATMVLGDGNQGVDIFFKISAPAAYTIAGDSITVVADPAQAKVDFSEDDIRIRGIDDAAQAEAARTEIYAQFAPATEGMKEIVAEPTVLNGVKVINKQMTCTIDDEVVTFRRKKK